MTRLRCFILVLLFTQPLQLANAWDSVGHRLTAAITLHYLSDAKQAQLITILRQHPRFEQDFIADMPASISNGDDEQQAIWLLGQAAYWPDIARGLVDAERQKYNRPTWHFNDGAWVRDAARDQGNTYIGITAFKDIMGEPANSIRSEAAVHNVMTALDYNTWVLAASDRSMAERAIALCWVLHLMGDIHQPLHAGALFSAYAFANGDRGGNGIATDDGNLHARWDRALADDGVATSLRQILQSQQRSGLNQQQLRDRDSDWSQWMNESRQLLQTVVYSAAITDKIASADRARQRLQTIPLDDDYVSRMKQISQLRLGQAGIRLATWFENELP